MAGHTPLSRKNTQTGAVTPSITLATTFERAADGSFPGGHIYTRTSNPNRAALEDVVYAPTGFFLSYTAWRKNVSGIAKGPLPFFWDVSKTA